MGSSVQFGYGIQRLIDAQQKFLRTGHPVYLRMRNFSGTPQQSLYAQLGFTLSPVAGETGTEDILISPPPSVRMVSVHNIGQSGGKLRFGARVFGISASFVDSIKDADPDGGQVAFWRGPTVVGLVTESLLFSIEDIRHQELAGRTILWNLTCNANELR